MDDKGYCQESIDKEVLGVVLDSWREWVQSGRPDRKEIYSTETHFGLTFGTCHEKNSLAPQTADCNQQLHWRSHA